MRINLPFFGLVLLSCFALGLMVGNLIRAEKLMELEVRINQLQTQLTLERLKDTND